MVSPAPWRAAARAGLRRATPAALAPALVYLAFFCLYTWPWAAHPTSRFFTDSGDGYQNVWNLWWVNHALTALHQLPWHTDLLHYPYGTSLLGQTMNPFNGLVGIVLLRFMPLVVAFNTLVVFSFVATGVTAFWLCRFFCHRFFPSLVGGFAVTFSAYHLAKTLGLMQLVSLEWVPLFILLWWQLLTRPRTRTAVAAALTLLLVLLCDYYYFLFCVATGVAILIHLWRQGELTVDRRSSAVFVVLAALLTVPLPAALVWSNVRDAMVGGHAANQFSADPVTLLLDGGHWRFASLTHWYWASVGSALADSSVYLSLTVTALVGVAVVLRRRLGPHARFWLMVAGVAAILSLGPSLMIHGNDTGIAMPFALLQAAVPLLNYNLEPERLIVMTTLAAGVLVALVLSRLDRSRRRHQLVLVLVGAALIAELWPGPPPVTPVTRPAYVAALRRLPAGGVIDNAAVSGGTVDKSLQLYDQVLDGQPLAFGYISRTPDSVAARDDRLQALISDRNYSALCHQYHFRYLTVPAARPLSGSLTVLYRDEQAIIYDLC